MLKKGEQGESVKDLQEMLTALGFRVGKIDGHFGSKTEAALLSFQQDYGLYCDGIAGPNTQAMLRQALLVKHDEQQAPLVERLTDGPTMAWQRVPADVYRDGYNRFFLREDAAQAYLRVREQVVEAGGVLTSSGARRALNAHVNPSRSATSFHYAGLALDLMVGSGMENTHQNPYIITAEPGRRWRVYAKAEGGELAELNAITYGARTKPKPFSGKVIDLTAVFEQEGFCSISARPSFFNGGSWLGAEWWHFQYEAPLQRGVSTFGGELLKVYSESQLASSPPWAYRHRTFGIDWC
ncbi:MAG: peptidoglycan-binding domain-containing protein [Pontibacterium sp.]